MNEYPYQEPYPMGGTNGEPESRKVASLQPEWLREYEREQMSLVQLLKLQVTQKRKEAFAERAFNVRLQSMVDAYDVVLGLIDKIQGGK